MNHSLNAISLLSLATFHSACIREQHSHTALASGAYVPARIRGEETDHTQQTICKNQNHTVCRAVDKREGRAGQGPPGVLISVARGSLKEKW